MKRILPFLIILLGCPPLAAAEEVPESARVAAKLTQAYDAGHHGDVEIVAKLRHPDPWLVAFRLCVAGRADIATSLAEVDGVLRVEGLPSRVKEWTHVRVAPDVMERWNAIEAAYEQQAWRDVVYRTAELELSRVPFLGVVATWYRGESLYQLEEMESCTPVLAEAARRCKAEGWLTSAAAAFWSLGYAQHALLSYEDTFESWTECAVLYKQIGAVAAAAKTRANLGSLSAQMGAHRDAVQRIEEVLPALRAHGDSEDARTFLLNLALARRSLGEYAAALRAAEESLQSARDDGDALDMADAHIALATCHWTMGDYDAADRSLVEARGCVAGAEDKEGAYRIAQVQGTRGLLQIERKEYSQATATFEDARKRFLALDDPVRAARALDGRGAARGFAGEWSKALEDLRQALKVLHHHRDIEGEIDALYWIGEFERRAGRREEARAAFDEVRRTAKDHDLAGTQMDVHLSLAQLYFAEGRNARAMESARAVVEVMMQTVRGLGHEQSAMARAPHALAFELGMRAAAAINDASSFSYFVESGRAGALLETLEAREAIRLAAIPADLRRREEEARTAEATARSQLLAAHRAGKLRAAREHGESLESAQWMLRDALEAIHREAKAGADLLYTRPARLQDITKGLGKGEALVEFAYVGNDLYALVATSRRARIVRVGSAAVIDGQAAGLAVGLADKSRPEPTETIKALRETLLEPLGLGPGVDRLLVLPDGNLHRVPLGVLDSRITITYIPSATAVLRMQPEQAARGRGVLALGDPVYDAAPPKPGSKRGDDLQPLPATRDEVKAIGTKILLGKDATEKGLRKALKAHEGRWRAIHFACHGRIDAEHPMRSSLAITPAAPDDGYLTAFEVLNLRLDADLAVLSACATGRGKEFRGEGLFGMTRAFLLAGAPRMLVSLWDVDDAATQALMTKFYELWNVPEGSDPPKASVALREAQMFVRSHDKWKHPYYWAAWVLWGLPE